MTDFAPKRFEDFRVGDRAEFRKTMKKDTADLCFELAPAAGTLLYEGVAPGIAAAAATRWRPQPLAGFSGAKAGFRLAAMGIALGLLAVPAHAVDPISLILLRMLPRLQPRA